MIILEQTKELDFILSKLTEVASKALCSRSKCGSIIVSRNVIIGEGYNSMPCGNQTECFKDSLAPTFKSDKTCCIHAEQRAIVDALKDNHRIPGSSLYFLRLDDEGNPKHSGEPYCSICSKMALDVGIKYFHLWHKEGWTRYETNEYNELTFKYK